MNYPATFSPTQSHIIEAGNVFQVLGSDGTWNESATAAAYQSWQQQVRTIAANAGLSANTTISANVTASVSDLLKASIATG